MIHRHLIISRPTVFRFSIGRRIPISLAQIVSQAVSEPPPSFPFQPRFLMKMSE